MLLYWVFFVFNNNLYDTDMSIFIANKNCNCLNTIDYLHIMKILFRYKQDYKNSGFLSVIWKEILPYTYKSKMHMYTRNLYTQFI